MVALLIFLMCACVGSVVLMAGATSAGRASSAKTDENKQRYAVQSAANLIANEINEKSEDGFSKIGLDMADELGTSSDKESSISESVTRTYTVTVDQKKEYPAVNVDIKVSDDLTAVYDVYCLDSNNIRMNEVWVSAMLKVNEPEGEATGEEQNQQVTYSWDNEEPDITSYDPAEDQAVSAATEAGS